MSTKARRVGVTLGQNYAIVCPNLTYLWRHSWTAQFLDSAEALCSRSGTDAYRRSWCWEMQGPRCCDCV